MNRERYVELVPKAELHVHLEGAIQPATLFILAKCNGVHLPVQTMEEMQAWFTYHNFDHFIEIFMACTRCLKTVEDYELIAYEFGATMARQNVRYAEVTFTPCTHHFTLGVPFDTYFAGLTRGRLRAQAEFGVQIRWIFDIVRNFTDEVVKQKRAEYTLAVAREGQNDGVVALGLGGAEVGYPPEQFAPFFEQARLAGLHCIPHAGETVGPASIWGAIRTLSAERIGHGVRAIEDPELMLYLKEHAIPLELCPTSNVCLGVYPNLQDHPLARLHAAGIPITINSDDPPLFNTSIQQEVELLFEVFQFDIDIVNEILLNGVRYSFLPESEKHTMDAEFRQEMAKLQGGII